MRILRISLRNIASLAGTQTVDFTREPLRSTGIFAISGPTGSGKSTLLDALCLALYEKTPRLHGVRSVVKLADGTAEISQKDPGTLLRRGTAEGFAEVAFVGVDGEIYTARWRVRRGRNRADNPLQAPEIVLFHGDVPPGETGPIAQGGRKGEVLPAIEQKIGLSFEQFRRAVLLAQNDFATFLKAEDRERAEILQALTGTGRFEMISRQVFQRAALEEEAVEQIQARLAGNEPLAGEARTEAEAASTQAETTLKAAHERLAEGEKQQAWLERLAELTTAVARAGEQLQAAREARELAAPRQVYLDRAAAAAHTARPLWTAEQQALATLNAAEKRHAMTGEERQKADAALSAKVSEHAAATKQHAAVQTAQTAAEPALRAARDLDSRLEPLTGRLRQAEKERAAAEALVQTAQRERDQYQRAQVEREKERAALANRRAALAQLAPFAPDAAAWLDRLEHAQVSGAALAAAEKELAQLTKATQRQAELAATERARESPIRVGLETLRTALETAEVASKAFDSEQIAERRQRAARARDALHLLELRLRDLERQTAQAATLQQELAQLRAADEADLRAAADVRGQQLPQAEAALAAARDAHEQARAAVDAATVKLRAVLRSGAPCPVCGGAEHPYAAHPPAPEALALAALQKVIAGREAKCAQLHAALAGFDAGVAARKIQAGQKAETLSVALQQAEALRKSAPDHPEVAVILAVAEVDRRAATEARLRAVTLEWQEIEKAETAQRAAEKHRDACRARLQQAAEEFAAFEKRLDGVISTLAVAEAAEKSARARHGQQADESSVRHKVLAPVFAAIPGAEAEFFSEPAEFRQRFANDTAALLAIEKRQAELAQAASEAAAALVPLESAVVKAGNDLTARRGEETEARAAHEALLRQRAALFGGRRAEEVEGEFKAQSEATALALAARAAEAVEAGTRAAAAKQAAEDAGAALATARQQRTAAASALDAWLAAFNAHHATTSDRAALETMLAHDEPWFREERLALMALESAVKTAEGALAATQRARGDHEVTRPAGLPEDDGAAVLAAAVDERRAAVGAASMQANAARAVVLADDLRISANAQLARELQARQTQAVPWQKLNELIGSADGAKFRNIAQRHTLDILLGYANAQLEQLATRYRLERIPQSLNLLVLDRDMGDERRSVHSLSGGESFLVSLALALGLASLTSQRLRIESLFIDEGFGSLDPDTLHTAMGALMQLEAQGRKIGVISHVAEMAEAIPVQIKVVKGRGGASQIIVPGVAAMPEPPSLKLEPPPPAAAIAEQLLAILRRESADGKTKISARSLRAELGCTTAEFNAARDLLGEQIKAVGKSLMLNG